jgi:hypothetical protein
LQLLLLLLQPHSRVFSNTKVLEVYQVLDRLSTTMDRRDNSNVDRVDFKAGEAEVAMIGLETRDHSRQTNPYQNTRFLVVSRGFWCIPSWGGDLSIILRKTKVSGEYQTS